MSHSFKIVILVASLLLCAPPLADAGDTSWMLQAKCGIFLHYPHHILLGYPQTGLLRDFGIAQLKRIARAVKGDAPPHDTHILYDNLKEK